MGCEGRLVRLAGFRDARRVQTFAYSSKAETDHKSKSALPGGKAVNSCNNVVNNGKSPVAGPACQDFKNGTSIADQAAEDLSLGAAISSLSSF